MKKQDLLGVGKEFAHTYDLNIFRKKDRFKIKKKDIISCCDVSNDSKIFAFGKFNKTIGIFNENDYN